jgi:tetratricopeptide (TPR) repeat protein
VDIWALGCILFELATGIIAFAGDWAVRNLVTNKPGLRLQETEYSRGFRKELEAAVDAMLRKDWQERPKAVDICDKFRSYIHRITSNDNPRTALTQDPFEPRPDDSEAISDWKSLIKRNPKNVGLLKRLSDAYRKVDNIDMEIAVLEIALQKDPSSRYYEDTLADALERREAVNLSSQGWMEILDKPGEWVIVDSEKKNDLNNLEYRKELVYEKPGDLQLQQQLVKAFRKVGDIDAEIATFNDLIRRFPAAWYLADRLSDAYKTKGDMDEAIVSWKELVNMEPANIWWQNRLAEAYKIKKDPKEEAKVWRDMINKYPDVESLQERLATAYDVLYSS